MVCKPSKKTRKSETWYYKGQKIRTVTSFKYLGVFLSHDGTWKKQVKASEATGKRSARALSPLFRKFSSLPVKFFLRIFDATVVPAALYGAELWGTSELARKGELNRPANFFYRMILGLPQSAPVSAIHLELSRLRLHEEAIYRAVKFWLRLTGLEETRLLSAAFKVQMKMAQDGVDCWAYQLKNTLGKIGLGEAWERPPDSNSQSNFLRMVKRRIEDQSFAVNRMEAKMLPSLNNYCKVKESWERETYLEMPLEDRRAAAILRLNCSYSLPINREPSGKYCGLCGRPLKNPWFHFLYSCLAVDKPLPLPETDLLNHAHHTRNQNSNKFYTLVRRVRGVLSAEFTTR